MRRNRIVYPSDGGVIWRETSAGTRGQEPGFLSLSLSIDDAPNQQPLFSATAAPRLLTDRNTRAGSEHHLLFKKNALVGAVCILYWRCWRVKADD